MYRHSKFKASHPMKEGVKDLCSRIMATDLESEEIQVDLGAVDEVVNRGKTIS